MKRSPIKPRRDKPRRNDSRITHTRMHRKSISKTAEEAEHLGRVASMGCLVCQRPAQVHHVVSDGYQRLTRDHRRAVALCAEHHTDGPNAVHRIGHRAFNELYNLDLLEIADRLWSERNDER